jgi:hypothetical protein
MNVKFTIRRDRIKIIFFILLPFTLFVTYMEIVNTKVMNH